MLQWVHQESSKSVFNTKNMRISYWLALFNRHMKYALVLVENISLSIRYDWQTVNWLQMHLFWKTVHVIFNQLTEALPLLRSNQKRWTEIYWQMFICHAIFDQLIESHSASTWPKHVNQNMMNIAHLLSDRPSATRATTFAWRWAKEVNTNMMSNARLPCDICSVDRVATIISKWTKEVNISVLTNSRLPCDLPTADRDTTVASRSAKEVNITILMNSHSPCDL